MARSVLMSTVSDLLSNAWPNDLRAPWPMPRQDTVVSLPFTASVTLLSRARLAVSLPSVTRSVSIRNVF